MKKWLNILLIISVLVLNACDVDFDPNDNYTEQMSVYCLMDQDDDTTFVRVEKCFLGSGNALIYAKQKDSLYYKENELSVKMYVYDAWDTNNVKDSLEFKYGTTSRNSETFYSGEDCPIYYCVTKNKLNVWNYYKLVITNLNTGKKVTSGTYLIADYSIKAGNFTFTDKKSDAINFNSKVSYTNKKMKVEWTNADASNLQKEMYGKQYQLNVRFNYLQNSKIKYIDIPINKKTSSYTTNTTLNSYVAMIDIINGIKGKLSGQEGLAWYAARPFEIRVLAGNLSLFDYISINTSNQNSLNYSPSYTNFNGGIGLFASRRTHISSVFNDKQVDGTLKTEIKNLGLGF